LTFIFSVAFFSGNTSEKSKILNIKCFAENKDFCELIQIDQSAVAIKVLKALGIGEKKLYSISGIRVIGHASRRSFTGSR